MSIEDDIDELLGWLRAEERSRQYETAILSVRPRALFEADCCARWIAAVEELRGFRANHLPQQLIGGAVSVKTEKKWRADGA